MKPEISKPQPQLEPSKPIPTKLAATALAAAVAGFLVWGASGFFNGGAEKGAMPVASNDSTFAHDHALLQSYSMSVSPDDADPSYTQAAMAALRRQAPQVADQFQKNDVKWYSLRLWDAASQDGDVVSVSVNGQVIAPNLALNNAGVSVPIPLALGANNIAIKALNQGALSTVTLGAVTGASSPVLAALPPGGAVNIQMLR